MHGTITSDLCCASEDIYLPMLVTCHYDTNCLTLPSLTAVIKDFTLMENTWLPNEDDNDSWQSGLECYMTLNHTTGAWQCSL